MLASLKAKKAELARLREERGATDPILIIAGIAITLILLVGGSFAVSGFVANANNLNAKGDLDRIAAAQAAYMVAEDGYGTLAVGPAFATQDTELQNAAIGFNTTAGNNVKVRTSGAGWVAVTKSASGIVYMRTSESGETFEVGGGMVTDPAGYSAWSVAQTNMMTNSLGSEATSSAGMGGVNGGSVSFDSASKSLLVSTPVGGSTDSGVNLAGALSYSPKASTYTVSMDITGVTAGGWRLSSQGSWLSPNVNSPYTSVAAGETKRISMTFNTNTGAKGAFYLLRQSPSVATQVRISNILFEESPTANAYYDGSSAGNELTRYTWSSTPGGSLSRMETRTIASGTGQVWAPGAQPSGAVLPSGITWAQVASDLQEVKS